MENIKRIGIFGGSFDPPHIGHIICARVAAEYLNLEKVIVVPAAIPPHKLQGAHADSEARWKMVQASFSHDAIFQPSRIELDRKGISYTIETVKLVREQYSKESIDLYCLMGYDTVLELESWREPFELIKLVKIAALVRNDIELSGKQTEFTKRAITVSTPRIDVSSTMIRERRAAGLPIVPFVLPSVDSIISEYSLYCESTHVLHKK